MKVTVLGSGTSHGVPMIGCDCAVCQSPDPKNRRFRSSIVVTAAMRDADGKGSEHNILVDATPELRLQALTFGLRRVDAVLFTHTHADHVMGLDDMRRFNDLYDMQIPVFGDAATLDEIRRIYPYIFRDTGQLGGGKPRLSLHEVAAEFTLFGLNIHSFYVMHGNLPVLSYRFDQPETKDSPARSFAYCTDVNFIPPDSMTKLRGLDLLILDAVRYEPHSTHFGFHQALDVIAELQPERALLTHLSHHFDHATANAQCPSNVELAYDGQVIDL